MASALSITLCAALVLAAFVAAEAKGKGPSITHKVSSPPPPSSVASQLICNAHLLKIQVYFDISIGGQPAGRVTMGLCDIPEFVSSIILL
jgi:hypothetical protein